MTRKIRFETCNCKFRIADSPDPNNTVSSDENGTIWTNQKGQSVYENTWRDKKQWQFKIFTQSGKIYNAPNKVIEVQQRLEELAEELGEKVYIGYMIPDTNGKLVPHSNFKVINAEIKKENVVKILYRCPEHSGIQDIDLLDSCMGECVLKNNAVNEVKKTLSEQDQEKVTWNYDETRKLTISVPATEEEKDTIQSDIDSKLGPNKVSIETT